MCVFCLKHKTCAQTFLLENVFKILLLICRNTGWIISTINKMNTCIFFPEPPCIVLEYEIHRFRCQGRCNDICFINKQQSHFKAWQRYYLYWCKITIGHDRHYCVSCDFVVTAFVFDLLNLHHKPWQHLYINRSIEVM